MLPPYDRCGNMSTYRGSSRERESYRLSHRSRVPSRLRKQGVLRPTMPSTCHWTCRSHCWARRSFALRLFLTRTDKFQCCNGLQTLNTPMLLAATCGHALVRDHPSAASQTLRKEGLFTLRTVEVTQVNDLRLTHSNTAITLP